MPQVISSVKALIKNQNKYLFLKEQLHHGDVWDLPGGKIEYGEEPEAALSREVKEETSLYIRIIKPVGIWWFYSQNHQHQVICHTFLCEPIKQVEIDFTHNPADEHFISYRWASIEEALNDPTMDTTESLKKLLGEIK